MWSNKVEYGTAAGLYCTVHDVKIPLCMPEYYRSKIINHRFHVDNYKGELGIGYDIIIGRDMMVQLVLVAYFKHQVLQWDGAAVPMKEPSGLLLKPDSIKHDMRKGVYADFRTSFHKIIY